MADIVKAIIEKNINDFIWTELNSLQVSPIFLYGLTLILANKYLDDS